MDKTDIDILKLLQKNAKISNQKISDEIGLTPPSTLERVKKLEKKGIIKGYHTDFNKEKLGYSTSVFVGIKLDMHGKKYVQNFMKQIESIPEVIDYYFITGGYDCLIKMYAKDVNDLKHTLLDKLSELSVLHIETFLILEEKNIGVNLDSIKTKEDI